SRRICLLRLLRNSVRDSVVDPRQVDLEHGSEPRLTVNPNVAAALFHNTVDRRQSQAGSFTYFFRRKEGLEDSRLRLLVHAASGIADRQHDVFSRVYSDVLRSSLSVK